MSQGPLVFTLQNILVLDSVYLTATSERAILHLACPGRHDSEYEKKYSNNPLPSATHFAAHNFLTALLGYI